jgi:Glycosyltransferases involved in cell wall biogenesis
MGYSIMQPKLTIVVPVYNTEKYLKKCLDSIVNQTIDNIEIICVNDGSTDGSLDILKEYQEKDERLKIINKKNGGLASARNIGIEQANGEYITFVDSDDFIELNTYESTLSYFSLPKVDLVHFSTRIVIAEDTNRTQDEKYFEHKYTGFVSLSNDVITTMDVCAWNKIYKLSIIKKYNIRFPNGLWYEDNPFFWCYILVCDSAFFVNNKFYNYLIRSGSIMSYHIDYIDQKGKVYHKTLHELDPLLGFEYLLNFVFKWNLIDKFKPALIDLFQHNMFESIHRLPKKDHIIALKKSTKIVKVFKLKLYFPDDDYLISLSNQKYSDIIELKSVFLTKKQRLLGIWDGGRHHIFCFLGIKIKIRKK